MQGAGCSEGKGEQDLTETLDVRERRKDCMHFVEMLSKEQIGKNRKKFQFTIYLLDKIEEM